MQWEDLPESESIEDRRAEEPGGLRYALSGAADELSEMGQYLATPEDWSLFGYRPFGDGQARARRALGLDFAQGGPVDYPELSEFEKTSGDPAAALSAVKAALMFGRKKYGIGGAPKQNFAEGGSVDETFGDTADIHRQLLPEGAEEPPAPEAASQGNRFERWMTDQVGSPGALGRRVLGYLQSSDADPQLAQRAEMEVDPEGILDPDTRKLLAVEHAQKRGGPEASWRVLQNYRKKYDGYRAFAAAALQAQDIQGAARAASQAYPNALDGTSITFEPGEDGNVVANVRPRGGQAQQIPLTAEQFNRWLTGDEGQYDMVLARGGPAQLAALVARREGSPAPQGVGITAPGPAAEPRTTGRQGRGFTADPSRNREGGIRQVQREFTDQELIDQQYPYISQSGDRAKATLALREAGRNRENKSDVAGIRGQATTDSANIRAGASTANAQTRATTQQNIADTRAASYDNRTERVYEAAMARIDQQARRAGNADQVARERNAVRAIVEKLRNGQDLTPQERQVHERIMQGGMGQGQPAAPQQPAPPRQGQGGTPAARPAGAAFRDNQGRFYDKYGRPL